ncbi:MAG: alpha/beta hydrolase-fold protein [Lacunisphaera sp.]|nr:alpha/beta hydrolase-fold protein [Lacunisphaera sp.]
MALSLAAGLLAQQPAAATPPPSAPPARRPQIVSPEVKPDGHVTFRLLAPKAESVRLSCGDLLGTSPVSAPIKGADGVWEVTIGPIAPGAYRYNFTVEGVPVVDPRNPDVSESVGNVSSVFCVPGSDFMDTKDVPHGAVASVTYYSKTLGKIRRMHVYTPPGYELGKGNYPILYLLHGVGDSDDSWTSVGRAGFILDNLIAAKKAKPMVIVMPAGHTGPFNTGSGGLPPMDEFVREFETDIMPYAETHYRVLTDRPHRAIAGLSMGGGQTLAIAVSHLERFAYVGVFSSGLISAFPMARPGAARTEPVDAAAMPKLTPAGEEWEKQHAAQLDDAKVKKGLKLLWFATGKDDFLLRTSRGTVALLEKHGFRPFYKETSGAHTWINWRDYLAEFAPQLFQVE